MRNKTLKETREFTLEDMKKFKQGFEKMNVDKEIPVFNKGPTERSKDSLVESVKGNVKKWDQTVFEKTLAFTKFFLSEKNGVGIDPNKDWYTTIRLNFFAEFVQFYDFFMENGSNISNVSDYYDDFKSFFSGKYLDDLEKFELDSQTLGAKQTIWYKGIMDAFNQSPDDEKFWENDEYYMGFQRGTDIFRNLMKEAKMLFPVKKPKNKFVDQQKQLANIINKFQPKTDLQKSTNEVKKEAEQLYDKLINTLEKGE